MFRPGKPKYWYNLASDWLRVGTDIVGGTTPPTFNAAFSLTGIVPEPATWWLVGLGMLMVMGWPRRRPPEQGNGDRHQLARSRSTTPTCHSGHRQPEATTESMDRRRAGYRPS